MELGIVAAGHKLREKPGAPRSFATAESAAASKLSGHGRLFNVPAQKEHGGKAEPRNNILGTVAIEVSDEDLAARPKRLVGKQKVNRGP